MPPEGDDSGEAREEVILLILMLSYSLTGKSGKGCDHKQKDCDHKVYGGLVVTQEAWQLSPELAQWVEWVGGCFSHHLSHPTERSTSEKYS